MDEIVLLLLVAGGWILFTLVGSAKGISASKRLHDLEATIRFLRTKVGDLERTIARQAGAGPNLGDAPEPETPIETIAGQDTAEPIGEPARLADRAKEADSFAAQEIPPIGASTAIPKTRDTLEQNITSKWFVWLGGVALALSGIFVVKFSIEHGLLGPTTRVVLGVLMALAFGIASEWIRRREAGARLSGSNQALIPAALTAAAVAAAFGSIYAGYALYGLFSSTVAFVFLVL
ncbi:MAG: DUF2339 domain-containing protein, partial [Verrucomicrobia bacterium]|nr:DUF2339 domain-containing protein [Verrucomicrobiota bacterium]